MSEAVLAAIRNARNGPLRYPHRVAAQISMYPMDFRHVEHLLAHQIRVWGPMVDRIVVTVDTHRSKAGRYRGTHFDDYLTRLRELVADIATHCPTLEMHEVDYGKKAKREVAQAFFGCDDIPVKAWDGGPFYAYFFGLLHADARYVVHFDGDMLFGKYLRRFPAGTAIRVPPTGISAQGNFNFTDKPTKYLHLIR